MKYVLFFVRDARAIIHNFYGCSVAKARIFMEPNQIVELNEF